MMSDMILRILGTALLTLMDYGIYYVFTEVFGYEPIVAALIVICITLNRIDLKT